MERADDLTAAPREPALYRSLRRSRTDRTLRREGDVMGLTTAIALLVALSAGDDLAPHSKIDVLAIVWGTTVGLALAHAFAVMVSARLVSDPTTVHRPVDLLMSQVAMSVLVALAASLVVIAVSSSVDRLGARLTAAVFIGGLVGFESRAGGSSTGRAVTLAVTVTVAAVAVALTKWFLSR